MAYAVLISHGFSKTTVRFPTPDRALAEARDQVEHGAQTVTIRVASTGEEFTIDQFAEKMTEGFPS